MGVTDPLFNSLRDYFTYVRTFSGSIDRNLSYFNKLNELIKKCENLDLSPGEELEYQLYKTSTKNQEKLNLMDFLDDCLDDKNLKDYPILEIICLREKGNLLRNNEKMLKNMYNQCLDKLSNVEIDELDRIKQRIAIEKILNPHDSAFQYLEMLLQRNDMEINFKEIIYNTLSTYFWKSGNLSRALQFYKTTLKLYENQPNDQRTANLLVDIASLEVYFGDLKSAVISFDHSLSILKQFGDDRGIAFSMVRLGFIYYLQGNTLESIKHLRQGTQMWRDIGDPYFLAESYVYLINSLLSINQITEAKKYLNELFKLVPIHSESKIKELCHIAEGLVLTRSTRLKDAMKGVDKLESVLHSKSKSDIELIIVSISHYTQALLKELSIESNIEILDEIREAVDILIKYGKEENAYRIIIEANLVKIQLFLLEGKFDKINEILEMSASIANQNDMSFYRRVLGIQESKNKQYETEYYNLTDSQRTFQNLITLFETDLSFHYGSKMQIEVENPIMLLILIEAGSVIYCHKFSDDISISEHLIGNYLTAINVFSNEAFATEGIIESIRHREYTIAMKSESQMTFAYVFSGQSTQAVEKLEEFMNKIQQDEDLWQMLIISPNAISASVMTKLNNISEKISV